jgi:hypothetical protein
MAVAFCSRHYGVVIFVILNTILLVLVAVNFQKSQIMNIMTVSSASSCTIRMNSTASLQEPQKTIVVFIGDSVDRHMVRHMCGKYYQGILCEDKQLFEDASCNELKLLLDSSSNFGSSSFFHWISSDVTSFAICWLPSKETLFIQMYNMWGVLPDAEIEKSYDFVAHMYGHVNSKSRTQFIQSIADFIRSYTQESDFFVAIVFQSLFWDFQRYSVLNSDDLKNLTEWSYLFERNTTIFINILQDIFPFADLWIYRNWNNFSESLTQRDWTYQANEKISMTSSRSQLVADQNNMCLLDYHHFDHDLPDSIHPSEKSSFAAINGIVKHVVASRNNTF